MINRFFLFGAVLCCCTNVALACPFDPKANYDSLPNQTMAVIKAKVLSVEARPSGERGSCLQLSYSMIEPFLGVVPSEFLAQSCFDDVSVEELNKMQANDEVTNTFGYVADAEVLLAVVKQDNEQVHFRLAILDCWGPFHLRLDRLSEKQKTDFISEIKKELAQY